MGGETNESSIAPLLRAHYDHYSLPTTTYEQLFNIALLLCIVPAKYVIESASASSFFQRV